MIILLSLVMTIIFALIMYWAITYNHSHFIRYWYFLLFNKINNNICKVNIVICLSLFVFIPVLLICLNWCYFLISYNTSISDLYVLVLTTLTIFAINKDSINKIMNKDNEYLGSSFIHLLYEPLLLFYKLNESKYFTCFATIFITYPFIFSILDKSWIYLYRYLLILWQFSLIFIILCIVFSYLSSLRLNHNIKLFKRLPLSDRHMKLIRMIQNLYPYLFKTYIFDNSKLIYKYWNKRNFQMLRNKMSKEYNASRRESINIDHYYYAQILTLIRYLYDSLMKLICSVCKNKRYKFSNITLIRLRHILSILISNFNNINCNIYSSKLFKCIKCNVCIINKVYNHSDKKDFNDVMAKMDTNRDNLKVSNYIFPQEFYGKISNEGTWYGMNMFFENQISNSQGKNNFLYHYVNDSHKGTPINLSNISYKRSEKTEESINLIIYRHILESYMTCEISFIKSQGKVSNNKLINQLKKINLSYFDSLFN